MLNKLYSSALDLAKSRFAPAWLALIAFTEASFFPIPPDLLLVPLVLAQPRKAWYFATICTLTSVIGGILGWYIGAFLLEYLAMPIIHFYHGEHTVATLQTKFKEYGIWFILIKGLTPIPYKLVTIASGAAHFPLVPFILASLATRALRFYLVAGLLYFGGPRLQNFIEKRLTWIATVFAMMLLLGVVALKFV